MFKRTLVFSMCMILAVVFSAFAQQEEEGSQPEELSITTYYPSPFGSYNELEVYRSVTYKPVNKAGITDPKEGEVVYEASDDKFYYYNGSAWVAQAGGSGVLYIGCTWASDYRLAAFGWGWGNQCGSDGLNCCRPVNCPTGWTSVATYPEAISVACSGSTSGGCFWGGGWSYWQNAPVTVGRTVRVCTKD